MNTPSRRILGFAPVFLLALVLPIAACSKSSSGPTNPGGGTKELNSGDIAGGGATFVHTFMIAGTYPYHCERHSNMRGTVVVAAGQPVTAAVSIENTGDMGFNPQTTQIAPGGTVTWTNIDVIHTVTSD